MRYERGKIARQLADRVRALRLERGWSQLELATRAEVALPTYQLFELKGSIALERLVRIAVALHRAEELMKLFAPAPARTVEELATPSPTRKRGRTNPHKSS